jgi:hypothetical protein
MAMRLAQSDRPFAFAPYATALDSGARQMATSAAQAGLSLDAVKLAAAVQRVEDSGRRYDASAQPENVSAALEAAQQLDLIAYSANGYASVAFPAIANAIATGKQPELDAALHTTITALDKVNALLQ